MEQSQLDVGQGSFFGILGLVTYANPMREDRPAPEKVVEPMYERRESILIVRRTF
jgi:hypothetical protein